MPRFFKLRHLSHYPREIKAVFLSQICFNFSFVGFKSIFVLYAFHHLSLPQKESIDLFAILMTLSYASSLLGGYLSDQLLNPQRCQFVGGLLCVLSMIVFLARSAQSLYLAMALLSIGSGCLKPNISALLASFFKDPQDPAKDTAFTHLYLCMNVGNFSGPLLCSFISHHYGWVEGLVTVATSFSIGTLILFYGLTQKRKLDQQLQITDLLKAGLIIGLSLAILCYLLQSSIYRPSLMAMIVTLSLVSFGLIYYRCTSQERQGLHKIMGYILCFALFCSLFEQAGSTIMLFIEKAVDREIFVFILPSASLLSLNPIYVLILGLVLPILTKRFLEQKKPLEGTTKMALGFFFIGLSFVSLAYPAHSSQALVPLPYILIAFLFQTMGELHIVPITLSNITKYGPPRYLSVILSFWLMAIGYGHYLAGIFANIFLGSIQEDNHQNTILYGDFFTKLCLMSIFMASILGAISYSRYLKKRS